MSFVVLCILLICCSTGNFITLVKKSIPPIPTLPTENILKIFSLVTDRKTKRNFQLALRSDHALSQFQDVFSKNSIKKDIKNILRKNFNRGKAIDFETLHDLLKKFLNDEKTQKVLRDNEFFRYYFVKYFLKKYVICNKYLLYLSQYKFVLLFGEQLRVCLNNKPLEFYSNEKNYYLELVPYVEIINNNKYANPILLEAKYGKKENPSWMIFYRHPFLRDHSFREGNFEKLMLNKDIKYFTLIYQSSDPDKPLGMIRIFHGGVPSNNIDRLFIYDITKKIKSLTIGVDMFYGNDEKYINKNNLPSLKKILAVGLYQQFTIDFKSFKESNLKSVIYIENGLTKEPKEGERKIIFSEPSQRIQLTLKNSG